MTRLTGAEKVARYRERKVKSGLVEFRFWLPKEGVEEVRRCAERVKKRLLKAKTGERDRDGP